LALVHVVVGLLAVPLPTCRRPRGSGGPKRYSLGTSGVRAAGASVASHVSSLPCTAGANATGRASGDLGGRAERLGCPPRPRSAGTPNRRTSDPLGRSGSAPPQRPH